MTGTNKLPLGLRIVSELGGASTVGQQLILLLTGRILVCPTGAVKKRGKQRLRNSVRYLWAKPLDEPL